MSPPISKIKEAPVPFRQSTLLMKDDFCKYCGENGINVTLENLEEFHRIGLFYPAVRVDLGCGEFRKIYAVFNGQHEWRFVEPHHMDEFKPEKVEDTPYYMTGPLMMGGDDWLKWYEPHDLVSYPASNPYFKWQKREHSYFITDREKAGNVYELLYEKRQIIALQMIRDAMRYYSDFTPLAGGRVKRFVQEKIAPFYHFLRFYLTVEEMHDRWVRFGYEKFDEVKKEVGEKNALEEWQLDFTHAQLPAMKKEAKEILNSHKFTIEDIGSWLTFLAKQSVLNTRKPIKKYVIEVQDKTLINAEETNRMILILNDLLYALTGKKQTVKDVLNELQRYCEICHTPFIPRPNKKDQWTCADPRCMAEHTNKQKRLERRAKAEKEARMRQV